MTTRFADHLLDGDHASRPAATAVPVGTLYACSDHGLIYQSDGTTWSTWATLDGGGGGASGERVVCNRSGVTSYTTTSTSFADIDATNLTATVNTPSGGKRYMVTLQARVSQSATAIACFDFSIDGTRAVSAAATGSGARLISMTSGTSWEVSVVYITGVLAAGAHTIRPQWRTNTGTLAMQAATDELVQFAVVEL